MASMSAVPGGGGGGGAEVSSRAGEPRGPSDTCRFSPRIAGACPDDAVRAGAAQHGATAGSRGSMIRRTSTALARPCPRVAAPRLLRASSLRCARCGCERGNVPFDRFSLAARGGSPGSGYYGEVASPGGESRDEDKDRDVLVEGYVAAAVLSSTRRAVVQDVPTHFVCQVAARGRDIYARSGLS